MIDMEKIALIEREGQSFIRYELSAEETVSKIEAEMLKNNKIPHVLSVSEIKEDESTVLLYEITGKVQLLQRFHAPFSCGELYKMLYGLCQAWINAEEYMLDRRHLILYPEFLCIDQETGELFIMDLPVSAADDMGIELRQVLVGIFQNVWYSDEEVREFSEDLLEYIDHHDSLLAKEFAEFLEQAYQNAQGVLLPICDPPSAPEYIPQRGKNMVEEEMAKETLKERFRPQEDEVKTLEDMERGDITVTGTQKKKGLGGFLVPTGKEQEKTGKQGNFFMSLPDRNHHAGTGSMAGEKKKKTMKKEKIRNEKQPEISIPGTVPEEKGRKETTGKERKGLLHIFGKKKEKEKVIQEPEESKKLTPVEKIIESRGPIGEGEKVHGTVKSQDMEYVPEKETLLRKKHGMLDRNRLVQYGTWSFQSGGSGRETAVQRQGEGGSGTYEIERVGDNSQSENKRTSGQERKGYRGQGKQQAYVPEICAGEMDWDATILSREGMDLDATILNRGGSAPVHIPVLRSRETGEIIKIGYSGFLVGRQRMKNGVVIKLPNVKQPDLILPLQDISHSHASFFSDGGRWFVKDENSLNGTFVNEENIGKGGRRILEEGDVVRFASEVYEFLVMEE